MLKLQGDPAEEVSTMRPSNPSASSGTTRPLSETRSPLLEARPVRRSVLGLWSGVSAIVVAASLMTDHQATATLWFWGAASALVLFAGLAMRVRDLERFILRGREELKRHHERLQEAALTDPMTGLPNRRHLMERLDQEVARSDRSGAPLACLFLDVDRFAEINNQYLHEAGDSILASLAGVLRRQLRSSDVLGRYGGDEFVILLPDVEAAQVEAIATRIYRAVARHRFRALPPQESVTVSVGASLTWPDAPLGPAELLKTADEALYRAKEAGRNGVALHESLAVHVGSGTVPSDELDSRDKPAGGPRPSSGRVARTG